eukprot:4359535-Pleurochrysis_carterae.AAC.2
MRASWAPHVSNASLSLASALPPTEAIARSAASMRAASNRRRCIVAATSAHAPSPSSTDAVSAQPPEESRCSVAADGSFMMETEAACSKLGGAARRCLL